jgi:hypothetical protein
MSCPVLPEPVLHHVTESVLPILVQTGNHLPELPPGVFQALMGGQIEAERG